MNKLSFVWKVLVFNLLFTFTFHAQTPKEELLENFRDYFSLQREVAYLHLNKSVLLQGEQLGISAFVVNKSSLEPSEITSNLYIQIKDSKNQIIREELLLVQEGIASSVYDIDSDFAPGDYTITAFTNWMRNFDERNYFTEKIKVVASNIGYRNNGKDPLNKIDAQFLPESGHLLHNVLNHVGIIVKDSNGHGVPNAIVQVKSNQDGIIDSVKLNEFGIGKFSFTPNEKGKYHAVVIINGEEIPVEFVTKVEDKGILLSATPWETDLRLQVITNSRTLKDISGRNYFLAVQGRNALEIYPLNFRTSESIPMIFDFNKMDPGVNILTLFNEDLLPVAERLVFNYVGLPLDKIKSPETRQIGDTLHFKYSFDNSKDRSLSISILPKKTLSYKRDHTIISYNLLQPFLTAAVENAGWYFENPDKRKKYALDNLLLTQGWSSYDWTSIFESKREIKFPKENYFSFEAQVVNERFVKRDQRYVVHATSINPIDYFVIPEGNQKFIYEGLKVSEGDTLAMSRLRRNNELLPAALTVRFFPDRIPFFRPRVEVLSPRTYEVKSTGLLARPAFKMDEMEGIEELDEVLIETTRDKNQERERRLNQTAFKTATVITKDDLLSHQTLGQFLRFKGLHVIEEPGSFRVFTRNQELAIFLDGMRAFDQAMFYNYDLHYIDYIDIDKSGISSSVRGGQGSISIYSDKTGRHAAYIGRNRIQEFGIPLGYSRRKKFYTPKYENTSDLFFEEFGVIDWKPEMVSKNGKNISFFIQKPDVDFKLIIEGITSDGLLIHEVHEFSADELP